MSHDRWRRCAAGVGALTGPAGGALMATGVSALPHPWTTGYVSEAGGPGARLAGVYQAGVVLLAITLILLGLALGSLERICLLAAGALAGVSSRVSCTSNCPLPPYEHTTAQDLVHAGSSTSAIGLTTLAMLIIAAGGLRGGGIRSGGMRVHGTTGATIDHSPDRRFARICFAICAPLLVALALALLALGRGAATAILERVALVGVLGWVEGCALGRMLRAEPSHDGDDPTVTRSGA